MTCAKKRVWAVLTTRDGRQFTGTNDCLNPVDVCPRLDGEGYAKCGYVCQQPHHAEIDAMKEAHTHGADLEGGLMVVGHHRVCDDCKEAMVEAGISWELSND